MSKAVTFLQAQERFLSQGRNDIKLCCQDYNGWKSKAKFYDLIEQDYFFAIPNNVFNRQSVHLNRRKEKR